MSSRTGGVKGRLAWRLSARSHAKLEKAFLIVLREDFQVIKAYLKPSIVSVARPSGPEPMEIDVIESS